MFKELFIVEALTTSPAPAKNYYSDVSPATAEVILNEVIAENYHEYLDYNGDGKLNIADYVGVCRRYQDNNTYGNEITIDRETVYSIATENYPDDLLYYEFDFVNNQICRQYELTTTEICTANIYLEFENYSDNVKIEVNPFTESVKVIS